MNGPRAGAICSILALLACGGSDGSDAADATAQADLPETAVEPDVVPETAPNGDSQPEADSAAPADTAIDADMTADVDTTAGSDATADVDTAADSDATADVDTAADSDAIAAVDTGTGGLPTVENMFVHHFAPAEDMDDLYWDPESFEDHYPATGSGPFVRFPVPACDDGTTPASRVCAGGEPPIRCTDGSRPMFWVRKGTNDRWLIRVQNGAMSCEMNYGDAETSIYAHNCWNKYHHDDEVAHFSSRGVAKRRTVDGIFRDDAANPAGPELGNKANPFNDYNMIYFDKCVGDRNLGDTMIPDYVYRHEPTGASPAAEAQGPVYFHGFRILKATLRFVHDSAATADLSYVLFMTQSNGSNGLYMYMDRLAEYVRSLVPSADVRGMPNGMIRSSLEVEATVDPTTGLTDPTKTYDYLGQHGALARHLSIPGGSGGDGLWASPAVYQEGGLEYWRNVSWGATDADSPTIDASCLAAHPSDPHACLDHMHVLLNHVSTPLFVVAQQRDSAVRSGSQHRFTTRWAMTGDGCDPTATCCHDENYKAGTSCATYPGVPFWTADTASYHADAFSDRVIATMAALRLGLAIRSELRSGCSEGPCDPSGLPQPPHGAFIDDHAEHTGTTATWKATSVIEGSSLEDRLAAWLEQDADQYCVDVSDTQEVTAGQAAAWGTCPAGSD